MNGAGTDVSAVDESEPRRASIMDRESGGWSVGLALGTLGLVLTLLTLNDPGLTVDEPINVGLGKAITTAFVADPAALSRSDAVYSVWAGGHDYPPLSRLLLGLSHRFFDPAPTDKGVLIPRAGRPASAIAYALLILFATRFGWRLAGPVAGWTAGSAILLMPRLFAHAHFGSSEMVASALFLWGLMAAAWAFDDAWSGGGNGLGATRWLRVGAAGVVLGLALLTKLNLVLLPLTVIVTTLLHRGRREIAPLLVWSGVGCGVFAIGWPWLWPFDFPDYSPGPLGSLDRLVDYLSVAFDRASVYVWYFGRQYPNPQGSAPWTFVWVFFLVTVPVGLQALGFLFGCPRCVRMSRTDLGASLALSSVLLTLLFFTAPIERYDGERLFLFVFAPWAVVIGLGGAALVDLLAPRCGRRAALGLLATLLASQAYGVIYYHPFQLSYYSALIGGLRGAARVGLEPTYWGDSVSEDVLEAFSAQAPRDACAILLPTMHPGHPLLLTSPGMRSKSQRVVPGDRWESAGCRWAILFNRPGYGNDPLPQRVVKEGSIVYGLDRDGVWLSRVYRLPESFRVDGVRHRPAADRSSGE